ncbi:hypothetical protein EI77_00353 [Prosthecobacter fusiformis]|uniref:3-methyladenine DNA glycosylase n=1 Tax=Prosthecobacter fusiformis TaxID=48464 RepID=A0A4R7SPW3_9BACT|nr:hypothetical protein [Prosthecobacter fusiformis]TDU81051.1 hypothetical protein EI77_00353 [Prosthecobacter fusiformis]
MTDTISSKRWSRQEWHARRDAHLGRVASLADDFVQRRSCQGKHPVHDFLFTYYNFSPAKLKQWMPPLGVSLEVHEEDMQTLPWLGSERFIRHGGEITLDETKLGSHTRDLARWVGQLCANVLERAPRFRCFGLHEWAMVYRQTREQIRHQGYELRLAPEVMAQFIESQSIGCSHYDAFRFFTPEAKPMNVLQPVLETRLEMEQGACLHANMDLYKWATKLWPWIGSDLVGKVFALACEGRDLDMRASPYDLRHLGYEPVCIETTEGRLRYEQEQRTLAEKAVPLREELRMAAGRLVA